MWINDQDGDWEKKPTVNEGNISGIEPSIVMRMKNMLVGDTIYTAGKYTFQIIRKT